MHPHPRLPPERGKGSHPTRAVHASQRTRASLFRLVLVFLSSVSTAFAAPDFPALTGRVVDEAGILTPAFKTEISAQLAAHEQASSNQVVVVTLKSLRGYDISDYGVQLGRHWGIGQKGKNNGALLIIAPTERKLRIEVGYGFEGVLTDALSRDIIEHVIKPPFRQQNYEQGIRAGVGAMLAALSGETPALPPPVTAVGGDGNFDYLYFLFFLAPLLASFGRVRKGKRPSLGSRLWVGAVLAPAGAIFWFIAQNAVAGAVIGFVSAVAVTMRPAKDGIITAEGRAAAGEVVTAADSRAVADRSAVAGPRETGDDIPE